MNSPESITPLKPQDPISERAAELFGQRRFGNWNDADQIELDAWLAESILHEVAWLRLQGIAARADRLAALNSIERNSAASRADGIFHYRRFVLPLLAAASIAVVAMWGPSLVASWLAPPDGTDSTAVGGRTLLSFADHTQIELNTNTAVRTRMTNKERTVWLEKGEAWFQVAHDAAHPFTVIVGTHRVTDLGTEFLIRRDGDNADVTLVNGRAAVSNEGLQTATLIPGEEVMATPASLSVTRKTPQEMADELAWRRGMLVFRRAHLSDVVREFNRYNATKLEVDPAAANDTITADIPTDDYATFLHLAESVMNLRVDREGSIIRISRGDPREEVKKANSAVHVTHDR